jgi:hypothetical protein
LTEQFPGALLAGFLDELGDPESPLERFSGTDPPVPDFGTVRYTSEGNDATG